jgi:hypothetical protein
MAATGASGTGGSDELFADPDQVLPLITHGAAVGTKAATTAATMPTPALPATTALTPFDAAVQAALIGLAERAAAAAMLSGTSSEHPRRRRRGRRDRCSQPRGALSTAPDPGRRPGRQQRDVARLRSDHVARGVGTFSGRRQYRRHARLGGRAGRPGSGFRGPADGAGDPTGGTHPTPPAAERPAPASPTRRSPASASVTTTASHRTPAAAAVVAISARHVTPRPHRALEHRLAGRP